MKTQLTLAIASTLLLQAASAMAITVPGTADPYLAGLPNGSSIPFTDAFGVAGTDSAPAQSPVLAANLVGGATFTFYVAGSVAQNPTAPFLWNGDGNVSYGVVSSDEAGLNNYIAGITAPVDALVGVFLGPGLPTSGATPSALDFSSPASRDFLMLSPALQQPFFIGDGLTSLGVTQRFVAPAGATRLFLGTMDSYQWADNIGSYAVQVVPEPASGAIGLCGLGLFLFRRGVDRALRS